MTPASVGFQCPECVRGGHAAARPARGGGLPAAGRRWGTVTLGLIGANVAVYAATAVSAGLAGLNPVTDNDRSPLGIDLYQIPAFVAAGDWWRVFTAAFLHIGPVHLLFNMLALLVFGSELERRLGHWRFAGVYLVSLLGGAAALQLFSGAGTPTAGASTAIYGLLGAFGVLTVVGREDIRGLLTLLAINLVISLFPGVSLVGHLGGLAAGLLVTAGLVLCRRWRPAQAAVVAGLGAALLVVALTAPVTVGF